MEIERRKSLGSYYTPDHVVQSLVRWAVRSPNDRLLDPSCGDGRFLTVHPNSVGVEHDHRAAAVVHQRAPGSLIHEGDFFSWAARTVERFECAAGNPPFIRYQRFAGSTRSAALKLCARLGAKFSALTSSWAPFLVATAGLLKPGGRMAFVAPAEIGHAPYAAPLLQYCLDHFSLVQVVAVQNKLFPDLSEDCWLLYCEGYGGRTTSILFTQMDTFSPCDRPPQCGERVSRKAWLSWNSHLRPFLLARQVRSLYQQSAAESCAVRLGEIAKVGIGYVSGANDFFHLRPSVASMLRIPRSFLVPAIRNGRSLIEQTITSETVARWWKRDEPCFLLRLRPKKELPQSILDYLDTPAGCEARRTFKCRNRDPWYVVPSVHVADAFLSYMSGEVPSLVLNAANCVATNSVHVVRMSNGFRAQDLQRMWSNPLTTLSCEIEGHPLGGGMLKLEPGEASRVLLSRTATKSKSDRQILCDGISVMRRWRHYA